ncbi:MAG: polysaccharide biosynthesis protein [Rhodospirillales bacterium]|nr:polysaccharide biosynthesis protein [Rhodospirillales bacterium]
MLTALIGVACIPIFIRVLGPERYGIVALGATFLSLSSILDLGVAPTLNREFAKASVIRQQEQTLRDLLRTFEFFVWTVALALGVCAIALAPVAGDWFRTDLPESEVTNAIALLGIGLAVQWPISLYSGGLIGLQKQASLALINVLAAAFRSFGAVAVLWLVSESIRDFLIWQILVSACQTAALATLLWRQLPSSEHRAKLRPALLRNLWSLALGMSGTTIIMVVATQADKIILSRLLPLETFGYYMIAWSIAGRLGMLTDPVIDSVFPHMTEIASRSGVQAIKDPYRLGVQLMTLVVLPLALTIAIFSHDISVLWTFGADYAQTVASLLSPLILGIALISLMDVPMVLQWAIGTSRLMFLAKLWGLCVLVPAIAFLSYFYGATAGAWAWPVVNGGVLILTLPLVHRRAFHGAQWWYLRDVMYPLLAITAVLLLWRIIEPTNLNFVWRCVYVLLASALASMVAAASIPVSRSVIQRLWSKSLFQQS